MKFFLNLKKQTNSLGLPPFSDRVAYLCFALLIGVALFFIWPFGNYPLNDDWVHTLSIQSLLEGKGWYYPVFLSPTLHVPLLYGTFLSTLFGFSFILLRLSTVFLAWGSLCLFYKLARTQGLSEKSALAASLLLFANPLFLHLSFTFMSDIPALFFWLASSLSILRGFKESQSRLIFLGLLLAVAGFFTRQIVILLAPAALFIFLIQKQIPKKHVFWIFGIPLAIGTTLFLLAVWTHSLPGEVSGRFLEDASSRLIHGGTVLWYTLLYLALFLAPLTLSLLPGLLRAITQKPKLLWLFGLSSLSVLFGELWAHAHALRFPLLGNILTPFGIGPGAEQVLMGTAEPWGSPFVYKGVTLLALLSLTLAVFLCLQEGKKLRALVRPSAPLILASLCYLVLLMTIRIFDRYLLFLLPAALLFFISLTRAYARSHIVFWTLTTALLMYGLIGTHNYFRWNDARWELIDLAFRKGAAAQELEGGYEADGFYLYRETREHPLDGRTPEGAPWWIRLLYPGHPMNYIVSFSLRPDYVILKEQPVGGFWNPMHTLYLLQGPSSGPNTQTGGDG